MKQALLYTRVSRDEQAKFGLSLDAQLEHLKEYCKAHEYEVKQIYSDEGISGGTIKKRKAFQNMIADAKRGEIIIFTKLDRFSRNLLDALVTIRDLQARDVEIEATQQDINTTTTQGRLMLQMMLVIAQNEREMTSDRINAVFADRIRKGFSISGTVPLGYKKVDSRYVVDPDTANIVQSLFAYYDNCNSLAKTTEWYNKTYPEYQVDYKNLKNRLKNTIYIGKHPSGLNDNFCESIISIELFDRIQQKIDKNIVANHKGGIFLFSKLIRCPECGNYLTANKQVQTRKDGSFHYIYLYRCNKAYLNKKCSAKVTYNEKYIEQCLLADLNTRVEETKISFKMVRKKKEKDEKKIESVKTKISRLQDLYINEFMSLEEFNDRYEVLKNELAKYQQEEDSSVELEKVIKELKDQNITDLYNMLTRENKRSFWHRFVKSIEIVDKKTSIPYYF